MEITITFGAWLIPAAVTAAVVVAAGLVEWNDRKTPAKPVGALMSLLMWGAAAIVSLVFWLIWALLS